jgi:hypothetical protein
MDFTSAAELLAVVGHTHAHLDFTSAAELLAVVGHTHAHLDFTSATRLLTAGGRTHAHLNFSSPANVIFVPCCVIVPGSFLRWLQAAYAIAALMYNVCSVVIRNVRDLSS